MRCACLLNSLGRRASGKVGQALKLGDTSRFDTDRSFQSQSHFPSTAKSVALVRDQFALQAGTSLPQQAGDGSKSGCGGEALVFVGCFEELV